MVQALKSAVDIVNSQLESFETIKMFKLLSRRFTEAAGEVTPSQKLRTRMIKEKYKAYIDELYQD